MTNEYVEYFNNFSESTVDDLLNLVTEDVYFKDPFNEFKSAEGMLAAMRDVFHVATDVSFKVIDVVSEDNRAYIKWDFYFRPKKIKSNQPWHVRGLSEIKFAENGRVLSHIDYWDAAEGFYEKIPLLGSMIRLVKRRMKLKGQLKCSSHSAI